MVATVFLAIFQDSIGWGWWWALPVGGGFVLAIVAFRILAQHVEESTKQLDLELDASEHDGEGSANIH